MPVPAKVGFVVRDHHQMEGAGRDCRITPGTGVRLPGGIWLHGSDRQPEIAHTSKATMITVAPMTIATSKGSLRLRRNGLNPTRDATLLAVGTVPVL